MVIFINQIRMKIGVMFGNPGNHDRRQRAEVLRLGAPRHPPHRRDQGARRGRRQPDAREGGQEQGGAARSAGRVRHHVRRGHLEDRRVDRSRRQGRRHREVGRLVLLYLGLPKDKLLVTIYHDDDDEAWNALEEDRRLCRRQIIRIATNDNFWSMGDTGPCGPCSEIFIDRGDHIFGGPPGSKMPDGDRFLEFWNLVFMQFEQFNDGRPRVNCPSPRSIPAWGSSASPAVLQGVDMVFETDLFRT
jgi:hypothetical protein